MGSKDLLFGLLLATSIFSDHGFINPSAKTWWTKRILSDDFHTSGRLSERQIKYASESGFKTLISLYTYDTDHGNSSDKGGTYLPSTANTKYIAEQLGGMKFKVVLPSGVEDWISSEVVYKVHQIMRHSARPVLFYCDWSDAATFLTLMHFLNVTENNDNLPDEPKVTEFDVYMTGSNLGYNYVNDEELRELITEITHHKEDLNIPVLPISPDKWYMNYWQMKPVYKDIFIAGQIQFNDLRAILAAGIKVIINNRKGTTTPPNHQPSQEEVNLLNIKSKTGTYKGTGRQSIQSLEANRIDRFKPNIFISDTATVNYEMNNTLEFGDHIGYNETTERIVIKDMLPDFKYIHLPLEGEYKYGIQMWEVYEDVLRRTARKGSILLHCTSGYRAGVLGLLTAAHLYCFNSTWAEARALEIGYNFTDEPDIITTFKDVLDQSRECPVETSSASHVVWYTLWIIPFVYYL